MAGRLLLLVRRSRRRHLSERFYSLYFNNNYSTTSTGSVNATVKVKQVTADNFSASLDALRPLIRDAAFVAVDAEMTGVSAAPWRQSFEWDSAAVRFVKLRHSASRFAMLQFGLCPFVVKEECVVAHPHNFHLFPSQYHNHDHNDCNGGHNDGDFLCQTSSLDFLATHRFDFNTCLRHGISYLSRAQEQQLFLSNASHIFSADEDADSDFTTQSAAESVLTSAVGFRHVIDLLSSQNKLIVGHNCILDIAHMYDKFIGPIPSTMEEFINKVHNTFPNMIDTKHIMNASQTAQHLMKYKSRSLSSAFSTLCPTISSGWSDRSACDKAVNVQVQADDNGSSWFNSGAKHEAGYDAFMTGCVFAQLCTHLDINIQALSKIPSNSEPLQSNVNLKPYLNHLYLTWNSGTVLDLATGTEKPEAAVYKRRYPKVVFENIVLLWGFPSSLNSKTLKGSIAKVFGADSVVSVFIIDSSAALVQFKKEELAKDFLVLKESLERRKGDPISMLHPLSVIIEGGNTKAGDYNTYKDVIASNLCKVLFKDQADASGVKCKVDLEN